jgi:tetratricopeptide (TPR) repeat protein
MAAGALLYAVLAYSYGRGGVIAFSETFANRDFNGWERMLTQSRVQWSYLGLFFWPDPALLNLDRHVEVSRSLWTPPTTLPATLAIAALALASLAMLKRVPRYGAPLASYLLLHVIESGPVNLELMFEHRMYLPSVFLAMLLGTLAIDAQKRWGRWSPALLLPFLVLLAVNTHERNVVWGNAMAFFADAAQKSPQKYRPQYNYGTELGKRGFYGDAERYLLKAIELDETSSEAHNQLGNVHLFTGRAEQALKLYEKAVALNGANAEALFNLGGAYQRAGRPKPAAEAYARFLEVAPPYLRAARDVVRQRLSALRGG